MKDITSTTFGYVIAFILPGLLCLIGIGILFEPVGKQLLTFSTAESNIGLFFLIILYSIILSLEIAACRFLLFECWLCKKHRINAQLFSGFSDEKKRLAIKTTVDEHYRYHQFWGGLVIVIPLLMFSIIKKRILSNSSDIILGLIIGIIMLLITFFAARDSFIKYILRSTKILEGEKDGKRNGKKESN